VVGFGLYGSIHGPSEYDVTIQLLHTGKPEPVFCVCCSRKGRKLKQLRNPGSSVANPGCLSRIRIYFPSRIPDPGSKGLVPYPGSGFASKNFSTFLTQKIYS
jgi:hypothetical protein